MLNFSLMIYFLELCFLVALQGNHVQSYIVSHHSMNPHSLLKNKQKIHYMSGILKHNCVQLCKICNGMPRYENEICRCHVRTNYPMQCLENLQRKAQILGINLIQRYPLRNKRCVGGNEEMGLPLQFLANTFNRESSAKSNDENVGAPSDSFKTFSGVITAPLFEQIKAVLLGDAETVENTMAGQFVKNLPNALSSFTGMLDTFNLASTRLGSGRTADNDGDESSKSSTNERLGRLIGAYPTIQQMRTTFVGDPYTGDVRNTLPVQLGKAVPKVLTSMLDLFQSLNIGTVSQNPPSSKSWLDEFDDDDDENDYDDNNNKNNDENVVGNTIGQQKIIVSPVKSSTNSLLTDNSGMNSKTIDEALSDAENLVNNPDSQIIQPEEAIIIISPTKFSQTLNKMSV